MISRLTLLVPVLISLVIHAAVLTAVNVVDIAAVDRAVTPVEVAYVSLSEEKLLEVARAATRGSAIGEMPTPLSREVTTAQEPAVRPGLSPYKPEIPVPQVGWEELKLTLPDEMEASEWLGDEALTRAEGILGPLTPEGLDEGEPAK